MNNSNDNQYEKMNNMTPGSSDKKSPETEFKSGGDNPPTNGENTPPKNEQSNETQSGNEIRGPLDLLLNSFDHIPDLNRPYESGIPSDDSDKKMLYLNPDVSDVLEHLYSAVDEMNEHDAKTIPRSGNLHDRMIFVVLNNLDDLLEPYEVDPDDVKKYVEFKRKMRD